MSIVTDCSYKHKVHVNVHVQVRVIFAKLNVIDLARLGLFQPYAEAILLLFCFSKLIVLLFLMRLRHN